MTPEFDEIETLLRRDNSSTVVARGAMLRAFNKEHGPPRTTSCSYGLLRSEYFDPEGCSAHKGLRPSISDIDGRRYIYETIEWIINKVGEMSPF